MAANNRQAPCRSMPRRRRRYAADRGAYIVETSRRPNAAFRRFNDRCSKLGAEKLRLGRWRNTAAKTSSDFGVRNSSTLRREVNF
jgi:hypothetical protein